MGREGLGALKMSRLGECILLFVGQGYFGRKLHVRLVEGL